jgi:GNAT superfamily N-acetyltransferase
MKIVVRSPIVATPRVLQVCGMFDLAGQSHLELSWDVKLPLEERPWNVGLIVGPSGCGKSTIARQLWPEQAGYRPEWPADRSVVDGFPPGMSIKLIVQLLSSVGFSSPPAWLLPYHLLSTGQQFRATLARLLAEQPELAVQDEFTSVVDRTVARIGAHALAKTVRARGQKFIAITCHEDVEDWLDPDWVFRPALAGCEGSAADLGRLNSDARSSAFAWRRLQRRPTINLEIFRVGREAWQLFKQHHYLSGALAANAICFTAFWNERSVDSVPDVRRPGSCRMVAFSAWVNTFTRRGGKREHRTVTLPDYQGVGIGQALASHIASLWKALGYRASSTTTHPAYMASRLRGSDWRMIRPPSLAGSHSRARHAVTRLTAGFEYVGPAGDIVAARRLIEMKPWSD